MQIGGIGDTAFGDKSPSFFSFRGVSKMKKRHKGEQNRVGGVRITKRKTKRQKS